MIKDFAPFLCRKPDAMAQVRGSDKYPQIKGTVRFCRAARGVIVAAEIEGLPTDEIDCGGKVFGFHIHEGTACAGTTDDPFAKTMGHFNPKDCPHPHHAGDMPPLFSAYGSAFLMFLTDRINIRDIIGKTVIIHSAPDDFTTQPSGNSGVKIACGVIR